MTRTHILSFAGKVLHYDTESDYDGMMPAYYENVIPKSHLLRGTVPHKVLVAGMFKGATLVVASYFWQRFAPATLTTQADVLNWFIENNTYISTHHIHNQLVAKTPLEDIMPNWETQQTWDVVKDWVWVNRPDLDFAHYVLDEDVALGARMEDDDCYDDDFANTEEYAEAEVIVNVGNLNDERLDDIATEFWWAYSDHNADDLSTWTQLCVRWDCILTRVKEILAESKEK